MSSRWLGIKSSDTQCRVGCHVDPRKIAARLAFVDIHLQDGPTGIEVGSQLASIGVSYVFMSGNVKRIPDDFAGAWGAIESPIQPLASAMR